MNIKAILTAITMSEKERAHRRKLDKAWGEYVRAHGWINQPGYVIDYFRHDRLALDDEGNKTKEILPPHDKWLLQCGVTSLTARMPDVPHTTVTTASTGQYDYDGNLTDLTLAEVARAFGFPAPDGEGEGDDDLFDTPHTPYVTTNAYVAQRLLKQGVPLQPPLDERRAKRRGSYTFLNPGNTTAAAAWWPAFSDAQQVAVASTFIVWWRAMRQLQRHHVSETYAPLRYKEMVRVKRNTDRRESDTNYYPGEDRDNDGNIIACITQDEFDELTALAAEGYSEAKRCLNELNLVWVERTRPTGNRWGKGGGDTYTYSGLANAYGEEKTGVQGRGTYSREYLAERAKRALAVRNRASESPLTEATGWWDVACGDDADDALNSAYVEALGVQEALRLAWRCGVAHGHRDAMNRCLAMLDWTQRLFGNYAAERLLDYFDSTLDGGQREARLDCLRERQRHGNGKGKGKQRDLLSAA